MAEHCRIGAHLAIRLAGVEALPCTYRADSDKPPVEMLQRAA